MEARISGVIDGFIVGWFHGYIDSLLDGSIVIFLLRKNML